MTEPGPGDLGRRPDEQFYIALLDDDPAKLYENAPCAYVSLLGDGTIVKANQTFLSWIGYRHDEVFGKRRLSEFLPVGDRIFYETHLSPLLRMQGRVREIALELVVRDGARLPVIANAVVDAHVTEQLSVIRVALFDATERRAYERELLDERRRAESSEAQALATKEMLEASLFPPALPSVDGLEIAAAYRPGSEISSVGGDFYDVFEQPDGSVFLAVGDVVGKGPKAAALTSLARHAIRTEALRTTDPAAILSVVAHAFLRYQLDDFCTALLVAIDPSRRHVEVATGGHPLPIRLSARGAVDRLGEPGQILGILPQPDISQRTVELEAGDIVVMFTDGVLDARGDAGFYGEDRLASVIAELGPRPAQSVVDGVVHSVLDFQTEGPFDDIVVVAWKVLDRDG